MAAISAEGLCKRYTLGRRERYGSLREELMGALKRPFSPAPEGDGETLWALQDVSFSVNEGEVLGVIGRNGAGKSTLLKILSRITEPTSGRATLRGSAASLLEVGTGFHPELTGRENIYLNGALLGMKRAEISARFDEIVAFSEVSRFLDTPVKRYSSGMYVRLAFAVAAHLEPDILFVDEVLAVGDAAFQRKCLGAMGDASRRGRTVLLVSHNMGAVKQLCSRCVLLDGGRVAAVGPAAEVVDRYLGAEQAGGDASFSWAPGEAPGDALARLRSMRLCSESGDPRRDFGTDEPVCLEVEFELLSRAAGFRMGFSLHDAAGTYIFYSSDDDAKAQAGAVREPGVYVSRCEIPGRWLNAGAYHAVVSGGVFGVKTIFQGLPRLCFSVLPTGGPASRFDGARKGVLCPSLPWRTRASSLDAPPAA